MILSQTHYVLVNFPTFKLLVLDGLHDLVDSIPDSTEACKCVNVNLSK